MDDISGENLLHKSKTSLIREGVLGGCRDQILDVLVGPLNPMCVQILKFLCLEIL